MTEIPDYQLGFSAAHRRAMYDGEARAIKAKKVLSILQAELGDLSGLRHLDLGCSTGFMTRHYAGSFARSTGVDIDSEAVEYARSRNSDPKVDFVRGDACDTGLPAATYDVITCTHIYEHVPDSARLVSEIFRLLKPGGACFFAAGNRYVWMEEHYRLPLLSAIPKPLADRYIRLTGKADRYYEKHLSYWKLRQLISHFELVDYTRRVIEDPALFHATDMVAPNSLKQRLALRFLDLAYWLCPTYLWVLRRPVSR